MTDTLKPAVAEEDLQDAPRLARLPVVPPTPQHPWQSDPGNQKMTHIVIGTTVSNAVAPENLGYRARCVIVDNFTNQYIYIPQGETWVPPYVTGYRVLLGMGTFVAQANVTSTGRGVSQVGTVAGEICALNWCENVILSVPCMISVATRATP